MPSDLSSSDESDVLTDGTPVKRCSRTRRGLKLTADDQMCETGIYTGRVNNFIELKEKITEKNFVENVIGPNNDTFEDTKKSQNKKQLETISSPNEIILDSSVSESPPPPMSPPPINNDIKQPRKRRMKRGMKAVMDKLQKAAFVYRNFKVTDNYSASSDFSDDILCDDDILSNKDSICLKVMLNSEILRISIDKNQKFYELIASLAKDNKVQFEEILLTHRDEQIQPDSTPASLNLNRADIIECYVIKKSKECQAGDEESENVVNIRVQSVSSKQKTNYSCNKFQPLSVLLKEYALNTKTPIERLIINFDGEVVDPKVKPVELDLEDGDCLDIFVSR